MQQIILAHSLVHGEVSYEKHMKIECLIIDTMNLVGSLVESYMYADMFNREYDGGSNGVLEKVQSAGVPVDEIATSISINNDNANTQDGGKPKPNGPFANKVVPAGLVLIQIRKEPDVEYENHFHPGARREVIPDSLYEILMESVLVSAKQNNKRVTPKRNKRTTPKGTTKKKNRN